MIKLNQFINEVKERFNLHNNQICLSGFSQGCMMSINLGLTSENEYNCIVGFCMNIHINIAQDIFIIII